MSVDILDLIEKTRSSSQNDIQMSLETLNNLILHNNFVFSFEIFKLIIGNRFDNEMTNYLLFYLGKAISPTNKNLYDSLLVGFRDPQYSEFVDKLHSFVLDFPFSTGVSNEIVKKCVIIAVSLYILDANPESDFLLQLNQKFLNHESVYYKRFSLTLFKELMIQPGFHTIFKPEYCNLYMYLSEHVLNCFFELFDPVDIQLCVDTIVEYYKRFNLTFDMRVMTQKLLDRSLVLISKNISDYYRNILDILEVILIYGYNILSDALLLEKLLEIVVALLNGGDTDNISLVLYLLNRFGEFEQNVYIYDNLTTDDERKKSFPRYISLSSKILTKTEIINAILTLTNTVIASSGFVKQEGIVYMVHQCLYNLYNASQKQCIDFYASLINDFKSHLVFPILVSGFVPKKFYYRDRSKSVPRLRNKNKEILIGYFDILLEIIQSKNLNTKRMGCFCLSKILEEVKVHFNATEFLLKILNNLDLSGISDLDTLYLIDEMLYKFLKKCLLSDVQIKPMNDESFDKIYDFVNFQRSLCSEELYIISSELLNLTLTITPINILEKKLDSILDSIFGCLSSIIDGRLNSRMIVLTYTLTNLTHLLRNSSIIYVKNINEILINSCNICLSLMRRQHLDHELLYCFSLVLRKLLNLNAPLSDKIDIFLLYCLEELKTLSPCVVKYVGASFYGIVKFITDEKIKGPDVEYLVQKLTSNIFMTELLNLIDSYQSNYNKDPNCYSDLLSILGSISKLICYILSNSGNDNLCEVLSKPDYNFCYHLYQMLHLCSDFDFVESNVFLMDTIPKYLIENTNYLIQNLINLSMLIENNEENILKIVDVFITLNRRVERLIISSYDSHVYDKLAETITIIYNNTQIRDFKKASRKLNHRSIRHNLNIAKTQGRSTGKLAKEAIKILDKL